MDTDETFIADEGRAATHTARPVLFNIRLTAFQAEEVGWGLDLDAEESCVWGVLRDRTKSGARLEVHDFDGALYRLTSSRDILRDGADALVGDNERRRLLRQAASLQTVVDALVTAADGPDNLLPETRRSL